MRKIVFVNILLVLSMILSACANSVTPSPATPSATAVNSVEQESVVQTDGATYNEAPMLKELVQAGKLPPVEQRLPTNPMVVTPYKEVGKYGGEIKMGGVGDPQWGFGMFFIHWEHLVSWKEDFSGITPNIAERWEVSSDATEYTFYLRKGMKWSDGVEFTADDIMFYINDVLFDKDINKGGPIADWMPAGAGPNFRAEKIDDYTVKFIFPEPYGLFLMNIATFAGRQIAMYPAHYAKTYHKKYNPNVDDLVKAEEGVQDWVALFDKRVGGYSSWLEYPDRPTLYMWVVTQPMGTGTEVKLTRNPYYWKVDSAGNQLPYIDNFRGIAFQDNQSRTTAMANGDIDFIKDPSEEDRALFFDAMNSGKPIQIVKINSDGGTTNTIHFNRTVADPIKAEIFANKDFRIGVSYGINRQRIIDAIFNGQGIPSQAAPLESSPLFNEQLAYQYTEYDVEKANEYLDKVLPEKDSEGYRLDKTGKRLSIVFLVNNGLSYGQHWVRLAELIIDDLKAVGLEIKLNSQADVQFTELQQRQNEVEMSIYTGEGGAGLTAILDPRYMVPGEVNGIFGNAWYYWRIKDGTSQQVEMPADIQALRAKFEKVLSAPTEEEQIALMKEVLKDSAEQFYVLGISRPGQGYYVFSKRMGNVQDPWLMGWIPGVFKIMMPEQWYLSE